MPSFEPKKYQSSALASIEHYFRACQHMGNADYAFQETTKALWDQKSGFTPLPAFPEDMPYFCLRVPTGGGKTYLAAKSVRLVNDHLLYSEFSVILWLVPSTAIRDQTLAGLRQLDHPYHLALREAGPVTVIDLDGAKAITRSMLETSTVVIVATRQAFQVENEENRKVYESSGALMHLFDDLTPEQKESLLSRNNSGEIVARARRLPWIRCLRRGSGRKRINHTVRSLHGRKCLRRGEMRARSRSVLNRSGLELLMVQRSLTPSQTCFGYAVLL